MVVPGMYPSKSQPCKTVHLTSIQLEGLFTVLVGILFLCLFPKSPSNPVSLLGYRYFSERESQILQQRVLREDPSKIQARESVSMAEVKATVSFPLFTFEFMHKLTVTSLPIGVYFPTSS